MDILQKTKKICEDNNIKPVRSKGQNFLIAEKIYDLIVEAADINPEDIVLEVGSGLGFLTEKLAEKAKKVLAVELDDKLTEILKKRLEKEEIKNVEVINEDILKISNFEFLISKELLNKNSFRNYNLEIRNYKIVANLPYNITSVFLRKFLTLEHKPKEMVLVLQKEVAERIAAKPGKMSLLAVSVQFYANPQILFNVPASDFYPAPKVDSAVIQLSIKNYELGITDNKEFFRLVKIGFSSRRKMLKNNLAGGFKVSQAEAEKKIKQAGFSGKVRAQELSVADWEKLFGVFY